MARFEGNNDLGSWDLLYERSTYDRLAFPGNPPGIENFNFLEMTKYGRIDTDGNAIVANANALVPFGTMGTIENTQVAQNFVVAAFSDFQEHMLKACRTGLLSREHTFISSPAPYKAYISPIGLYTTHLEAYLYDYSLYLKESSYEKDVFRFGDYLKYLPVYLQLVNPIFPMTLTGWHRSKNSSIFTSGLAIDIANQDISNDVPKEELFLSAPEFSYYMKLAKFYGFSIWKNAPWVLVADTGSPIMKRYMGSFRLTPATFTDINYVKAYYHDIPLLRNQLLSAYNDFVRMSPYHRKLIVCSSGKTKSLIKHRERINANLLDKNYNDLNFSNLYIHIRNYEEGSPYQKSDLTRIRQNSSFFYRKKSPQHALEYVNEQFRSLYASKDGTLHNFTKTHLKALAEKRNAKSNSDSDGDY